MSARLHSGLLAAAIVAGCTTDRARLGTAPFEPPETPEPRDPTGSYVADQLIVTRDGESRELVGDPDTRVNLELRPDGSTVGQLKIGDDPDLRTKQSLTGSWRHISLDRLSFDFEAPTFLEGIAFWITEDGLSGDWTTEGLHVHVSLRRVN